MKATTTVTLMATTMLLTFADSEMPRVRRAVTAQMPMKAGTFMTPIATAPVTGSVTSTPGAAVSAAGRLIPRSWSRLVV